MKTLLRYRCPACGREFDWRRDGGTEFLVVHCDRCGKELAAPAKDFPASDGDCIELPCSCGGRFRTDAPRRCPFCYHLVGEDCLSGCAGKQRD